MFFLLNIQNVLVAISGLPVDVRDIRKAVTESLERMNLL